MVSAIDEKHLTYKFLMIKSVCDIENRECMLHICKNCKSEQGVKNYLKHLEKLTEKDEVM